MKMGLNGFTLNGFISRTETGSGARNTSRVRRWGLGGVLGTAAVALMTANNITPPADWPMFGQNPSNTATNLTEAIISTKNVAHLLPKWTVTTGGDVSARAAVVGGVVYFPDWGGNIWAVAA